MTETEWLSCDEPGDLICWFVDNREISDRQARLLVCGCVRRISDRQTNDRWRQSVEVGERFADGLASEEELLAIYDPLARMTCPTSVGLAAIFSAANPCAPPDDLYYTLGGTFDDAIRAIVDEDQRDEFAERLRTAERCGQAQMVRDIVGNPFRPIIISPAWLRWYDGLLVSIVRKMYDSRDFGDMPVLGDAIEEAGCSDQDILGHCRSVGEHVRGCWVVDLLLGKH